MVKEGKLVCLKEKAVLYIPWGYSTHLLYYGTAEEKLLRHGYHIPIFNSLYAKSLPNAVLQAICSHNISYGKRHTNEAWSDRVKWLQQFFKTCGGITVPE